MNLFFCSSKPASTVAAPLVGQPQGMSSSGPLAWGAGAGAGVGAGAGAGAGVATVAVPRATLLAALAGGKAVAAGAGAGAAAVTPGVMGGATRRTCPTSMTLGLSSPFQRAMSFQFWPLSSAMRTSVSPGRTV